MRGIESGLGQADLLEKVGNKTRLPLVTELKLLSRAQLVEHIGNQ